MERTFQLSMTDRDPPPPRRADAVRNRAVVLAKTIEVLRQQGAGVSVDEIARRAGVGAGTVIRSFGNKSKLIDSAIVEVLSPIVEQSRAAAMRADAEEALRSLLLDLAVFQHENRVLSGFLVEAEMPRTFELRRQLLANVTKLVERARSLGIVRSDIAMSDVAMLLSGLGRVADEATASPEQLRRYVIILTDGLRPAQPTPLPAVPEGRGRRSGGSCAAASSGREPRRR